ncbi:MAG: hypothetical protein A2W00_12440 [Candidatus Eisenbacteria bacterium RBG_16_71_46]|nr:MAG: hypothetical protein A2W00_12440 [Candidatus Eisenbacteria bacterium RBG_16_71_46]
MRGSVVGSALAHLALLLVLFTLRTSASLIVPGPEVVQVALIEPSPAVTAPVPAPAPPKALTPAPKIQPTEEVGVKLSPPKPPKKQPEPEPIQPKPNEPAPALPYAPVGNAGLRGQVSVDAADFEFTYYLLLIRNRIAANWSPPAGLVSGGRAPQATVYFRVGRDGRVSGLRLESSSDIEFLDRSALRAVVISDPLPPLPLGFSGSDLGIHFGFEFGGP